jgi:hypothetical protein
MCRADDTRDREGRATRPGVNWSSVEFPVDHKTVSQALSGSGGRSQLTFPAHPCMMQASPANCLLDTCPKCGR